MSSRDEVGRELHDFAYVVGAMRSPSLKRLK